MTHDVAAQADPVAMRLAFDLTCEPWLPAQLQGGGEKELSLQDTFAMAGEIRRLAGDLPTQDFALIRLLLAIVHDALLGGPDNEQAWSDLWYSEDPFAAVFPYLERNRDRFDLLSATAPFFQTPGLRTAKDEVFSLNRIVADVPNGEPFFTARFPGVERISFAEAARWVVHAHAYDTSGIKTGVVGDERAKNNKVYPLGVGWAGNLGGVLAEGRTLRETLLLNLISSDFFGLDSEEEDRPAWRRPVSQPGPDRARRANPYPTGPCDLYTWQSRRLLLHADAAGVHGAVLTYGDPLLVRNMRKFEPMTSWRRSTAQEKKLSISPVYLPQDHFPARAAWRGLAALIAPEEAQRSAPGEPAAQLRPRVVDWIARLCNVGALPHDMLIRLETFGMVYGTQQSVVDEVINDRVQMRVLLLDEARRDLGQAAVSAVDEADVAVAALGYLAADLAVASVYNDKRRVQGEEKSVADIARESARGRAYALLDHHFQLWLAAITEDQQPAAIREAWQQTVRRELERLGRDLVNSAGDAAWNGRVLEESKGVETWRNAASAERRFWFALRNALELAFKPASTGSTDQGDLDGPDGPQEGTKE